MVKQYFRSFSFSIGLYLQFAYYFLLFCIIVFLRSYLALVFFCLCQCLVVQNVLHKVNGIFRVLKKLFDWWCNHIPFSRYNDFRTLIYSSTNWPSRRTFGPKGQFFPIFLGFSEKNTLLSSAKKNWPSGLKKLFFWVKWPKRTVFSKKIAQKHL